MNLKNDLTQEERVFCEYWLTRITRMYSTWTKNEEKFSEFALLRMIKYEVNTRQRMNVLNTIHARYSKLRRKREMDDMQLWVDNTKSDLFPAVEAQYL